jgi:outer membrane protein TolC
MASLIPRFFTLAFFTLAMLPSVGVLQASPVSATLTLEQAVSEGMDNSPDLKKLHAVAERMSWTKTSAVSTYLPHLELNYDHYITSKYMRENIVFAGSTISFPAGYPQDTANLQASLTLFDGLGAYYKYQAADLNTEAAQLDFSRGKFEVEESIRLAFFQALAAQKLFAVAEQNVSTLKEHLREAKISARAGYETQFDAIKIEATLEEARADQEQADHHIQITRNALNEAMGVDSDDQRPLSGDLPVLTESDVPKDLHSSVTDRSDIQSLIKKEDAATAMHRASQSFWYPSVSLFAVEEFYKFGSFDPSIQANTNFQRDSAFGIRFKWNLFDGGYSYAEQQQRYQMIVEAENQTHKVLQQRPREIATMTKKFLYSVSHYQARLRALAPFKETVRQAAAGVKSGNRTHSEMLDAELDLFRAHAHVVKAQAESLEALGKLELALGRKIWKN